MNKFFYLHIPKTAGSFFNKFLKTQSDNFYEHIEVHSYEKNADILSGHIPYPQASHKGFLEDRKTIVLLRNPLEQVISHITFVRELAEQSEEKRFKSHAKSIQEIALRLKDTDLSSHKDIQKLIIWLEENNFWLFHDCQTRYLGGGISNIKPANLNLALRNIEKIDYVGITDRIKEFMFLLYKKEKFELIDITTENMTKKRYGLDINQLEIRQALQPFLQNDAIIYRYAKKRFIDDLYEIIKNIENQKGPRFSCLRIDILSKYAEEGLV